MRIQIVMNLLGKLVVTFSAFMIIPFFYSCIVEEPFYSFLFCSLLTALIGGLLIKYGTPSNNYGLRDGFLVVTSTWVLNSFLGSLPFYISGEIPFFADAFFESVSGLTATGASVVADIDSMPEAFVLWRGLLHWLGGVGIIVLLLSFLKNLGSDAGYLLNAEASVPVPGLIMPRIRTMAMSLWSVYIIFTIACFICLVLAGMTPFDAINHSFSALATGGYSSHSDGLFVYADNIWVKVILIFFMVIAGGNFTVYTAAYYSGLRRALKDFEFRMYIGILFSAILIVTLSLFLTNDYSFFKALDSAAFTVVSIQTGSGFAVDDYDLWPEFSKAILFLLMFVGGCSGSTTGGMKVIRLIIIAKSAIIHLVRAVHPGLVQAVRINGKAIVEKRVWAAQQFFFMYIICYIISVLLLTLTGIDLGTALGAVAGILGNVGLAFGSLGPTDSFAMVHPFAKYVLIVDMILGRLEILTVLVLLHPEFWDAYFVKKKVRRLQ